MSNTLINTDRSWFTKYVLRLNSHIFRMNMYCTTCIQITFKKKIKITYYRPFAIIMFLLDTFYRWDEHIMLKKNGQRYTLGFLHKHIQKYCHL